jgi:hypothetical protein
MILTTLLLGGALAAMADAQPTAGPQSPVDGLIMPECDFGEIHQSRRVPCEFVFSNETGETFTITTSGKGAYPFDSIGPSTTTVPPNGSAKLTAVVDTTIDGGNTKHPFPIVIQHGANEASRDLIASGFVESIIDEPRPVIDFGAVDLKTPERETMNFELVGNEVQGVSLVAVEEKPRYLDVVIAKDGRSAALSFNASSPWKYVNDIVRFRTDSKTQSDITVTIQADLHGDVLPDTNPFALGLVRAGNANEFAIRITDRFRKPLHLGTLSIADLHGKVVEAPCLPKADDCRLLKLTISDDQPFGQIHGTVLADLPDFKKQLAISVWGLHIKHDTIVKDLNEESAKAEQGAASPVTNSSASTLDQALKAATAPMPIAVAAPAPPPPGHGPLVRWSVANENLVHGYLIYRGDSEAGPFQRMTNPPIAADRVDGGSSYQWRDNDAVVGRAYWYYIVTLFNDGRKQRLSGAAKVVAK